MKKWSFLLFVVAFALFLNAGVIHAAVKAPVEPPAPPTLVLDGTVLKPVTAPIILNDYTMVPVRTVADNLGYLIDYDNKKKQVTVTKDSTKILMTIDDKTAFVNGAKLTLQQAPTIRSSYTLVPLRFIESFGVQVYWDSPTRSVFMFSGKSNGNGNSGSGDGGLIGVVDPDEDGSSGGVVDGGNPSDGGESGNPSDGGNPPDGNGTVTTPDLKGQIHEIRYDADTITVKYDGSLTPVTSVLKSPDRIVIDLPSSEFAADFVPALPVTASASKSGELAVTGHEALQKIRYAINTVNPLTMRIVLDLNQQWNFSVTDDAAAHELKIALKKPDPQVYTVVLDAGHGGSDPGAKSITGKWEKQFNLSVVLKVQALLAKESRINLVLTRQGDTYPSLDDRVNLANSLKANLFLSVHANSYKPEINGTETYYNRADSLEFAKLLHKNAVAAAGLKDNGVRTAGYKVIKYTTMPAVLLEVGYLSNKNDEKQLYDDAFQNRVAQAIAASIKQYFGL
ncbi:N-acetylmuramoyl-L-alanine amidase [Cohnella faecalis]|uniref:AMIN domain-containing protein n=1 Tax=Cohnella faecalis TaxID=2315694 RepID=A0A398CMX8_9BACL|nr:N-acetylmuramoyl-L-alanine amidase [Cohnella faecalis]RIE04706.1 AMIN domain-containing protein [Cohnella faecalis]